MAKLTELVGHAECPECKLADAPVYKNKRGKLVLVCPKDSCNCMYTYQSEIAQARLKKRTVFISEKAAPVAAVSESAIPEKVVPVIPETVEPKVPEVQKVPEPVKPVIPEKAPEPVQEKKRFSLFK